MKLTDVPSVTPSASRSEIDLAALFRHAVEAAVDHHLGAIEIELRPIV